MKAIIYCTTSNLNYHSLSLFDRYFLHYSTLSSSTHPDLQKGRNHSKMESSLRRQRDEHLWSIIELPYSPPTVLTLTGLFVARAASIASVPSPTTLTPSMRVANWWLVDSSRDTVGREGRTTWHVRWKDSIRWGTKNVKPLIPPLDVTLKLIHVENYLWLSINSPKMRRRIMKKGRGECEQKGENINNSKIRTLYSFSQDDITEAPNIFKHFNNFLMSKL